MPIIAPDVGIDLGTSNTLVYVRKRGVLISEPSVLVMDASGRRTVRAFGDEALLLLGRTTGDLVAVRPLQEGTIKDFSLTEMMLKYFIRKAIGVSRLVNSRAIITVPCQITAIERQAVREAARVAGIRKKGISLVDKPFAAALGCGLPVFKPKGSMVVDIGGGTTEAAVISLGGIVASRVVKTGGLKMDEAIAAYFKRQFNMLITEKTAEDVKLDLGSAIQPTSERRRVVRGRDLITGLPQTTEITASGVFTALEGACQAILGCIRYVLERTPPELAVDIMRTGIHLTGGAAQLAGLDQYIASELEMPVLLARQPGACAAVGIGHLVDNMELLHRIVRSSFLQEGQEA